MGLRSGWMRFTVAGIVLAGTALQGCRAEQPWPLWKAYTARFLDSQGRIIDHGAGDKTTSEGQAYGMFFALVVNDQQGFEKMLHWTEDNLAQGDLTAHLPAWSWGKAPDGSWKTLDANSASDADLWLAYDLLEAGRLWKIDRYQKLGTLLMGQIVKNEVRLAPGLGTVLVPGSQGFQHQITNFVLNPSYMPLQVLARLNAQDPQGPWASIADSYPQLLMQGSARGFAMDWVEVGSNGIRPSASPTQLAEGKNEASAVGSYDAIRVYLWLGMADKSTRGREQSLAAVSGMAFYLQNHVIPPLQVDGTGKVLNDAGTIGFSAAVIPYLLVNGRKTEANQQMNRLTASMDSSSGLYGRNPEYYDQNLALFATGWTSKLFQFDREGRLKVKWK